MIQELRIGNFVSQLYSFGCDGTKKPEWREWELDLIDIQDVQSRPEIYKPIPITEEWLVRFGFEVNNTESWYYKGNFRWSKVGRYWLWFGIPMQNGLFKHVHQLQNLYFALTGQELKLNDE